jgi:hypothetical protein
MHILSSLLSLTAAISILYPLRIARDPPTSSLIPADIVRQLGLQLSPTTNIFAQGHSQFANATARWQQYDAPSFSVVVEPGTEEDVQTTVKIFPPLPVSG